MVKVAVAGGSGSIGRFIVDAIVASKKHDLIVLSRAPNPALEQLGVKVIPVSYDNPAELEVALRGVHTVISAIMDIDGAGWAAKQLALLAAAKKVGAKRFAPSEFSRRGVRDDALELYAYKVPVEEALKKSGLEYTLFECGVFMNYLANGTPGVGYLKPLKFVPDIENCSAYLAGDGNTEVVLTRAEDVGAFVAASLDLPKWPEESNMEGDRLSYKDVIAIAEKIRGQPHRYSTDACWLTVHC